MSASAPSARASLSDIGKDVTKRLKIIPAKFVVEEPTCTSTPASTARHMTSQRPSGRHANPAVIKGSIATPEAIAHIMTQKFVMYSPLYRQEQEYSRAGVPLSRQTMSNWLLKGSDLWLKPVYARMKAELLKQNILHADETTLQVLHEPGKKPQSKSYMWLYRTGRDAPQQLVLFEYQQSRRAEHPETFLTDFRGYLHADGYAGYYKLPQLTVVACWAHARRKYEEALQGTSKKNETEMSNILRGKHIVTACLRAKSMIYHQRSASETQGTGEPILKDSRLAVSANDAQSLCWEGRPVHAKVLAIPDDLLTEGEISSNRAERSAKPL